MVSSQIRHLVLDVLRPHDPSLPEFASLLAELKGLTKIDVSLIEMNDKTQSLKVVLEGSGINFNELREHIAKQGAVIHSVDQVIVEKPVKHS